jgi:hypothetical protein
MRCASNIRNRLLCVSGLTEIREEGPEKVSSPGCARPGIVATVESNAISHAFFGLEVDPAGISLATEVVIGCDQSQRVYCCARVDCQQAEY